MNELDFTRLIDITRKWSIDGGRDYDPLTHAEVGFILNLVYALLEEKTNATLDEIMSEKVSTIGDAVDKFRISSGFLNPPIDASTVGCSMRVLMDRIKENGGEHD